jgi:hypothetical protein
MLYFMCIFWLAFALYFGYTISYADNIASSFRRGLILIAASFITGVITLAYAIATI